MLGIGCISGGIGVGGGFGIVFNYCCYIGYQGFFDLLWVNKMDMGIDVVCGQNLFFFGDYFGVWIDYDCYFILNIGIVGFVNGCNVFIFQVYICFDDILVI